MPTRLGMTKQCSYVLQMEMMRLTSERLFMGYYMSALHISRFPINKGNPLYPWLQVYV